MTPERLSEELHAAFPIEPVPTVSELLEPDGHDDDWPDQISAFAGRRWTEIDRELLAGNHSAFYYLSPVAFAYYLPAILHAALSDSSRGESEAIRRADFKTRAISQLLISGMHLYNSDLLSRQSRRFSGLSTAQADCVRAFLMVQLQCDRQFSNRYHAAKAMEAYWDRAEGPSADLRREFLASLQSWTRPAAAEVNREQLIQRIESAFADVPYPGDKNITGAFFWEEQDFEHDFRGLHWRGLHPDFLRLQQSALYFYRPDAMRFYLPAFLISDLLGITRSLPLDSALVSNFQNRDRGLVDYAAEKFSALSRSQREAVVEYLRIKQSSYDPLRLFDVLANDPRRAEALIAYHQKRHEQQSSEIQAALDNYWLPSLQSQVNK